MDAVLGLDVGTSSIKGTLIDARGSVLCEIRANYPLMKPRPGWLEQNPEDWWVGAGHVLRGLTSHAAASALNVLAIALTGQMNGAVLLDGTGRVVRPCIIWADVRSSAECDEINSRIGADSLIAIAGKPAFAAYTAPKLLWVRKHEPESYERTRYLLLPKDFISYRLTDQLATEPADASNTLLFDIRRGCWSSDIVDGLEIDHTLLPPIIPSLGILGHVSREAALFTGLRPGTPVIAGAGDSICEAVGNSVVNRGPVLSVVGSAGNISAVSSQPVIDPLGRIHTGYHATLDRWILTGVQQAAGLSVRWLLENLNLFDDFKRLSPDEDIHDLALQQALGVPAGAEGLIFLPYLTGERTPHLNPQARGVFFGIGINHQRTHFMRAVLEGVAYAQRDSVILLAQLGLPATHLVVSGGGARNLIWHQILADATGYMVHCTASQGGAAFGAAILALVAMGAYSSIDTACEACITLSLTAEPRADLRFVYDQSYALFGELYGRLSDLFGRDLGNPQRDIIHGE